MLSDMGPHQIRFPVQINKGKIEFFGGGLPPFKEGSHAEIVITAAFVDDDWFVDMLDRQTQVLMLPARTELRLVLRQPRTESLPARLLHQKVQDMKMDRLGLSGVYIVLYLIEDLFLMLRGPKPGQLLPCRTFMPDLQLEVPSLNQAFTELSRAFEPHRRSFGGNVFSNLYYESKRPGQEPVWCSLAALRDRLARLDMYALLDMMFPWYYRGYSSQSSSCQWAYPAVTGGEMTTLYLLDQQGRVWSEMYFTQTGPAYEWLVENGYERYRPPFMQSESDPSVGVHSIESNDESTCQPPLPPYRKPNGETVVINYSRFD